jgi:hypothetical protein
MPKRPIPLLSTLTINRRFIAEFMDADPPSFALGLVEEHGRTCGFLALRPSETIPPGVADRGFAFGHRLVGTDDFAVVHFAFRFYGFATYHVLVNPSNPVVQAVLTTMVESGDYYFFAINADGVTAFRSGIGEEDLAGLKTTLPRILGSTTTEAQYRRALAMFDRLPESDGTLLTWVCRGSADSLDLTKDRFDLAPASAGPSAPQDETPTWQPISQLPFIGRMIDDLLADGIGQYRNLVEARRKPYVLDDATVRGVIRVYSEQLEDVPLYEEQLARWRKTSLMGSQRREIVRLHEQLGALRGVLSDILTLAEELRQGTIDAILAKPPGELPLEFLLGRMPGAEGLDLAALRREFFSEDD